MDQPAQNNKPFPAPNPFAAQDVAPRVKGSPSTLAPAPAPSPFLEGFASPFNPFTAKDAPKAAPASDGMRPLPPLESTAPAQVDFSPVPPVQPLPAAARKSQILLASAVAAAGESGIRPRFFITTTATVDGFSIQAYLEVVSVEIVLPKDLLFRNPAPHGDLHRLKDAEDQLQKVKAKAVEELAEKAKQLGADGVVGFKLDFVNLDTVCCLCSAVGTAVRLS